MVRTATPDSVGESSYSIRLSQPHITMPTISEILAAKKAATKGGSVSATAAAPRESIAEKMEADALDARLAPVKPSVATAARKAAGIILSMDLPADSPNGERRGQATPIRALSEPVTPPPTMSHHAAWGATLGCTEADLCLMHDPTDPQRAWLAVRHAECDHAPILILSLPIYQHPQRVMAENEPF
jgi:hypothetical protein